MSDISLVALSGGSQMGFSFLPAPREAASLVFSFQMSGHVETQKQYTTQRLKGKKK